MAFAAVARGMTVVGALALAGSALADGPGRGSIKDTRFAAPFSWTGFYVGVNAGYAWADADVGSSFACPAGAGCTVGAPANIAAVAAAASGSVAADGFTGGIQAGYNWQSGSAVLGVEADFNSFALSGSSAAGGPFPALPANRFGAATGIDSNWLMTLRGRLGWAVSSTLMVYATAGLAVADIEVGNAYVDNLAPAGIGASSRSDTVTGWTAGAGLELALNRNWTLKTEYLYVDLGSVSTSARVQAPGFNPNFLNSSYDLTAHMARVGVNYKF
jgi:outer membrane immunogenic protein